ncbi:IclR family transcriptional regulator [Halobellus rufus]|uniref:IclR family transcriptional regulator n=1 Tax=Halobellus rufus TaxID=1448860 RepID=UPI000678CA39|nr:IclR family transcriptional regulator [Halobellus rufus]
MDEIPTVQTTETSLEIIRVLKTLGGATLSRVSRELEVSKSTARTHLQTLRKHQYVVMDDDGVFRLSLEFFDTGERVRSRIPIYEPAIPIVDELAEKTNEKAQIMVLENTAGYYIYRMKGRQGVSTRAGRQAELHCTSAGKAILAFTDRDRVREILDEHGLPERTDRTITDREAFIDTLDQIRERGFSVNDEERLRGLRAVGAPILDEDDTVLGAISLSGPTTHLRGDRFREELPELVMQSADVIHIRTEYS